jgi:hypothetical protein
MTQYEIDLLKGLNKKLDRVEQKLDMLLALSNQGNANYQHGNTQSLETKLTYANMHGML